MFFKEWVVLLVDDEPDVLSVSKLAMRSFTVYGLPLKIYTAASKAEAIALFQDNLEVAGSLAVAFIDVVMETDTAGLELCQYIREDLDSKVSQIFVRTGQPGVAPERDVIDRYDISGYFTKVETTEDKLYSLVKSSVRQYLSYGMSLATLSLLNEMIVNSRKTDLPIFSGIPGYTMGKSRSRQDVLETIHHIGVNSDAEEPRWIIIDCEVLFADEVDAKTGLDLYQKLSPKEGLPLSFSGDKYICGEDNYQLIRVTPKSHQSEVGYLFKTQFYPPEHIISLVYSFVQGLATIWKETPNDD